MSKCKLLVFRGGHTLGAPFARLIVTTAKSNNQNSIYRNKNYSTKSTRISGILGWQHSLKRAFMGLNKKINVIKKVVWVSQTI
jgi:hypothetical protein